eukprot:jgi/Tetstr1/463808/TSEL_008623.t1
MVVPYGKLVDGGEAGEDGASDKRDDGQPGGGGAARVHDEEGGYAVCSPDEPAGEGEGEGERHALCAGGGGDVGRADDDGWARRWGAELRHLSCLAAPVVIQMATQQGMVVTDQVMVGHLGAEELAAAALGNTWFNFWFYFLMGVSTALDTLCSQAHGANDMRAFWKAVGSSMLILNTLAVIMGVAMWFAGDVVQHLFMQPEPASGTFCRWLIPGLWPLMCGLVGTKVLQTRSIMMPSAVIGVITFLANIAFNWWFIRVLGFPGSPLATTTSRVMQMVLTGAYIFYDSRKTGTGLDGPLSPVLLDGLSPGALRLFLGLGLPGGFMMGMEASSFDITTALAGRLGTVAVDAHTILMSVIAFMFLAFPFGMSIAATVRARISGHLTFLSCAAFMTLASMLLYVFRDDVGALFVDDPEVQAVVADLAPIVVPAQVFDGLNGAGQGVLRGMGKQNLILLINVVGFWGCGLVPGYIMTFNLGLGLHGLWYGIAGACSVAGLLSLAYFLRTDMQKHAAHAADRVKALGSPSDMGDSADGVGSGHDDSDGDSSNKRGRQVSAVSSYVGAAVSGEQGEEEEDDMEMSLVRR